MEEATEPSESQQRAFSQLLTVYSLYLNEQAVNIESKRWLKDFIVCLDAFNKLTSLISLKIKNLNVTPFLVDHQGILFTEVVRDELHLLRYVQDLLFLLL